MVIVTRFETPALPDSHLLCTERICALQIALHPAQIIRYRVIQETDDQQGNAYDRCAEQSKEHVSSQINLDVFLCHKTISYGYCSKCRGGWEAPRSGFRRVQKNSVYFWLCKKRKPQILSGVFMANHANLDKNAPHLASGCISGQAGAILRIRCNQTASTTVLFILEFTFVSYW